MNIKKQKLELTWIGKDEQINLEPRILIEDPVKSYGDKSAENMLIYGDNLLALKALEQDYSNRIKCVYIDPPYNTGSAFESYDDGIEHSLWLSLMRSRLEVLYKLLSTEGIIYIQIDDREQAYLKVLCDGIFGRKNFVCTFIWKARSGQGNTVGHIAEFHEYILCYAKDITKISFKKIKNVAKQGNYEDEISFYKREQLRQWGQGDRREDRPTMFYSVMAPDGKEIYPKRPDGSEGRWRCSKEKMAEHLGNNDVDFVKDNDGDWNCYKKIRAGRITYSAYGTLLDDFGTASNGTKELKELFEGNKVFETPKPEALVAHLINLVSDEGDIVLDSFAGSGTTGAVSHKMKRSWIMVELHNHCHTVIIPRLRKVCDGADKGGVSTALAWKGGGGFKFYELAPSLLKKDKYDNWIIEEKYNATMLAATMTKHEGFKYCPDEQIYWKQGQSTEKDFIFTTTQFVTVEFLDKINEEMKNEESLLICAKSFQKACNDRYPQITVKKIPQMLLGRCEFGKEDYKLNIIDLPEEGEGDE
ncbi:MAG: site-specific DNA-methyltransferase [Candidatus Omnitrophota bacterium]